MEPDELDVFFAEGEVVDVKLNGESVWPTWFKIEWKGDGELSAKVQGVRLSTLQGHRITLHQKQAAAAAKPRSRARS